VTSALLRFTLSDAINVLYWRLADHLRPAPWSATHRGAHPDRGSGHGKRADHHGHSGIV